MAQFSTYNTTDDSAQYPVLAAGTSLAAPIVIQTFDSSTIAGTVASDQNGTLTMSQSFDGVNWDGPQILTPPSTAALTVTGGTPQQFTFPVIAPFVQVNYTNTAGVAQTYLRLFVRAFGRKG